MQVDDAEIFINKMGFNYVFDISCPLSNIHVDILPCTRCFILQVYIVEPLIHFYILMVAFMNLRVSFPLMGLNSK